MAIKVGVVDIDVCALSHLKEELAWAADKWFQFLNAMIDFVTM